MNRLPVVTLVLAFAVAAIAQQPAPPTTLHVSSRLVIVDVVVTDSHGRPVKGLQQSDFTLLEGKSPQTINHFDEHSLAEPAKPVPMPKLQPGVFTNFTPVHQSEPVNILLLDTLNTPIADQSYLRDQLLKYLKTSTSPAPVAIFGLTSRLIMLQPFTADPEILKHALDKKNPTPSVLLDPNARDPNDVADDAASMIQNAALAAQIKANVATFEAEQQSFQLQLRIRYTLEALNQLARYLAAIPGRKNLIWFSGAFPINVLPDGDSEGNKFAGTFSMGNELHDTSSLLSRAQIAVYPIDARGLMVSPTMSAENANPNLTKPGAFARSENRFNNKTNDEHGTMNDMAQDTGGVAFVNTNNLAEAVQSAIAAGSHYYTLTYVPTDPKWNGGYRSIRLQLNKSSAHGGETLAYRRGYYAVDPDTPHAGGSAPSLASSPDALHAAMLHGAPSATEVLFKVAVLPASQDAEPAALANNSPDPKAKGPWQRYMVQFAADTRDLLHQDPADGKDRFSVDFVTLVYDADGNRINAIASTISATPTPQQIESLHKSGLQLRQQISIPLKGDYTVRLVVSDQLATHLGAVEIPLASIKNLPALNLPPPEAAPVNPGPPK